MDAHRLQRWLIVAALALGASAAEAGAGAGIYITDHALDPASKTFDKDVKKMAKPALEKSGEKWHVYFVAYLSKPADADELNIVFYNAANLKEEPNAFPIHTKTGAKVLMSDVEVGPEDGVKPGKYDVRITRLVGGKEVVFARTKLQLK
jgi:hypothetical protein